MGYKIELVNGLLEQTYEQDATIYTDMVLSVNVEQGSFFLDTSFGLAALPKAITAQTVPLIKQRFEQAWQWLIDTGKAKSIDVLVEQDSDDKDRVNVSAQAVQANDQVVTYEAFVEVI
jgi:hypothetical protein